MPPTCVSISRYSSSLIAGGPASPWLASLGDAPWPPPSPHPHNNPPTTAASPNTCFPRIHASCFERWRSRSARRASAIAPPYGAGDVPLHAYDGDPLSARLLAIAPLHQPRCTPSAIDASHALACGAPTTSRDGAVAATGASDVRRRLTCVGRESHPR